MKKVLLGLLLSVIAIHAYSAPGMNFIFADSTKSKKAGPKQADGAPDTLTTRASTTSSTYTSSSNSSKYQLPFKTWALTINASFTNPYTDLKYRRFLGVSKPMNEYQWGVGLGAIHMLDGAFGIMGTFNAGALQGVADSNMDDRLTWNAMRAAGLNPGGNYFKANFYEGSFNLYWDISNTVFGVNRMIRGQNSGKPYKPRWVSIYAFGGIGFNYTTTHVYKLNTGMLDTTKINGVPVFRDGGINSLVVPIGFGIKFKLSKAIDLGLENAYHFTFTDLLDGFQYVHINNKKRDDFYSMTGLTLTVKLGTRKRDKEHIEWRNPVENIYARLDKLDRRVDMLYKDSDGDGVSDVFDKDNNTPEGAKVYGDGTAVDSDNDGVPDYKDVEPFSSPGAKVDENGKEIDSDGDGVPDSRDLEPNTPPGNMVNFQGVTIRKPGDNTEINTGRGGFFFPSIYFQYDKDNIDRQYESELQSIAKTMRENQGLVLKVTGYCDRRGTNPYNDDLGMRRARKVIDYMVRVYGFPQSSFEAISLGKRKNEKTELWINRRVDFVANN
jgi:outer membrane protein OmpA-like peptidoglycan-associated protein